MDGLSLLPLGQATGHTTKQRKLSLGSGSSVIRPSSSKFAEAPAALSSLPLRTHAWYIEKISAMETSIALGKSDVPRLESQLQELIIQQDALRLQSSNRQNLTQQLDQKEKELQQAVQHHETHNRNSTIQATRDQLELTGLELELAQNKIEHDKLVEEVRKQKNADFAALDAYGSMISALGDKKDAIFRRIKVLLCKPGMQSISSNLSPSQLNAEIAKNKANKEKFEIDVVSQKKARERVICQLCPLKLQLLSRLCRTM